MPIGTKTWQQGLDSQSACNLSGLANFLVELFGELRASGINDGDSLHAHPLVRLVVAQMAHLAYGSFDCGAGNKWQRAFHVALIETGQSPYFDRPLEIGEKERILARWTEEDRAVGLRQRTYAGAMIVIELPEHVRLAREKAIAPT